MSLQTPFQPGRTGLWWLTALREPSTCLQWNEPDWEYVLRFARRLRLLGRLAHSLHSAGLMQALPAGAQRALNAERRFSDARITSIKWVIDRITAPLATADYPLVLLKGAAYIGQDLSIAGGRLPSDLDILVPRRHIADAQARLVDVGWQEMALDAHDRHYYHELSHEVPPMRHEVHGVELDLHHNILPPVARVTVDADLLLARLQPCRLGPWQVLHPVDQVLHNTSHLFQDSEARDRIRDLVDLDGLLRHFGTDAAFWTELPNRARQLGLSDPLALGCHFARRWLGTPVPSAALASIQAAGPGWLHRAWLHPLLGALLTPTEPDARPSIRQQAAAQVVLVRYHLGRMPLRMLLPHLVHKWRATGLAAVDDVGTAQRDVA